MTIRAALFLLSLIAGVTVAPGRSESPPPAVSRDETAAPLPVAMTVSLTPIVTVRHGSPDQRHRLAAALARFAGAGLELPDLEVVFSSDDGTCRGHLGLFQANATPWRISICSSVGSVYEHELAHAWERAVLTDETREAFMELRGHTVWSDGGVPWNERGIEGVAFVIQQGLSGLPLAPALGTEVRSRLTAFELLTGEPAPKLVRWIEGRPVPCEDRPTALSRSLKDGEGVVCDGAATG